MQEERPDSNKENSLIEIHLPFSEGNCTQDPLQILLLQMIRMDGYDVKLWKRDPRDFQLESVGLRMSPSCSILRSPTEVLGAHVYHGQTSVQASVQESEESRHVPESDH